MDTKVKILACMNRAFNINNASEETSPDNCEGWDSMNHLNLVIELEEAFEIELEPDEIAKMVDYASVKKLIDAKIA